jgi:hypothetical protein
MTEISEGGLIALIALTCFFGITSLAQFYYFCRTLKTLRSIGEWPRAAVRPLAGLASRSFHVPQGRAPQPQRTLRRGPALRSRRPRR